METTTKQITHKTTKKQVKTFQDLGTWKAAFDMAVAICRQCESFPEQAQTLVSMLTETSVGVCTNIAQGFNAFEPDERDCFYQTALSLIVRLENQLLIAKDIGYLNQGQFDDLERRCNNARWILVKLRKINQEWAKQRA